MKSDYLNIQKLILASIWNTSDLVPSNNIFEVRQIGNKADTRLISLFMIYLCWKDIARLFVQINKKIEYQNIMKKLIAPSYFSIFPLVPNLINNYITEKNFWNVWHLKQVTHNSNETLNYVIYTILFARLCLTNTKRLCIIKICNTVHI